MKYKLTVSGRGATVSFGSLSDEIYKYIKTFKSPKAYLAACEEGKVPDEFRVSSEDYLDNDGDIFRALVAYPGDSVLTVTDSDGKTVFERTVVSMQGQILDSGLEIRPRPTSKFPDATRVWGSCLSEKGDFWDVDFETESFDSSKLKLRIVDPSIDGNNPPPLCLWLVRIEYDGKELDHGEIDTTESGFDFKLSKVRPLSKLDGCDWSALLGWHPEYAPLCDWSKLDDVEWDELLELQPQFADKRSETIA